MSVCARCSTNMIYRIESFSRCFFASRSVLCTVIFFFFFLYSAQKSCFTLKWHFPIFRILLQFSIEQNPSVPLCLTQRRGTKIVTETEWKRGSKSESIQVLDGILAYNTCYWNHLAKLFLHPILLGFTLMIATTVINDL